jgi:hypothetical protein
MIRAWREAMASSMLVHDQRLAGNPPGNLADNTYRVDATVPIAHAIGWIAEYARRSGGLTDLYVMCHGFESNMNYGQQMSMNTPARGGFGLQLCTEGLSLYNATLTSAFKDRIRKITIFSCAAADTAPYNVGTAADGMRFCGEISLWSNAEVIAAVETQYYDPSQRTFWQWLSRSNKGGSIDFGDWEGPVYRFTPSTPHGTVLKAPPPQ